MSSVSAPSKRAAHSFATIRRALLPACLTGAAALGLIGWLGSTALLRRRTPDPADSPANYDLFFQDVTFPSRDGIRLRGWWIFPPRANGRTLVICHGHNGSMDGDTAQAAALARAGFGVLLFNLRAHGGGGTVSSGEQVTFGAREVLDVLGALDWLEAEKRLTRVGLVGFSMGAGVALMTAAQDSRVGAVVADGTIRVLSDAIVGLGRLKRIPGLVMMPIALAMLWTASLRAGTPIPAANPIRWAGRVTCPVLFIHGEADPFVSTESARRLAARVGPGAELWIVPGAGHRDAYTRDPDAYYARVAAFLVDHL